MIERKPDWEQGLNAFFADHQTVKFEWGKDGNKLDCVAFAAGAVEAQTGVDLYAEHAGTYTDETGAKAVIAKTGNPNLAALVDTLLPRRPRAMAQRGDIVLTKDGNLAVVFGSVALAVGMTDADGPRLVRIDRAEWRRAWRVG